MKKTFKVYGEITLGVCTIVEAENEEEARRIADGDRPTASNVEVHNCHDRSSALDALERECFVAGCDMSDCEATITEIEEVEG